MNTCGPLAFIEKKCQGRVLHNEPLSSHTSFGIGGPADAFVWADGVEDVEIVQDAVLSNEIPFLVIGNGTNLLFHDEGFRGVVLRLGRHFKGIVSEGTRVTAGAGANLSKTLSFCAEHDLGGFEFAVGIPGTVGGAVSSAAWTRSGGIRDRLSRVTAMGPKGDVVTKDAPSLGNEHGDLVPDGCIITEVSFQLEPAPENAIRLEMERLMARRKQTQPLNKRSAGCVFRNPEHQSAGRIIDECGCKGMRVGGAVVSEKHANFIINSGGARSEDVLELIERVRERVHSATGVLLGLEIDVVDPWGGMRRDA
ncbi:MAG: UDP-N-acetylmuramate dehydrogenase [Gemmatimonadota bacterium]|nr:MAG: UDP-N-acetylmuramate dehydrogenase [Gemmatimonadota bacterium]